MPKPFGSHTCVYINCHNSIKNQRNLSYFKFPVKDVNRCNEWKKNCGNIIIAEMDNEDLRQSLICEEHFATKDISCNSVRKVLQKCAIPEQFVVDVDEIVDFVPIDEVVNDDRSDEKTVETNSNTFPFKIESVVSLKTYDRKSTVDLSIQSASHSNLEFDNFSSSGSIDNEVHEVHDYSFVMPVTNGVPSNDSKKLSYKTKLKRKLNLKDSRVSRLKKKTNSFSTLSVLNFLLLNKSEAVKTFVHMLCVRKSHNGWTQSEKQLSLSLYYKSPSAYRFMLYKLKFSLPSVRTIQTWSKALNRKTGPRLNKLKKSRVLDIKERM